MSQNGHVYLEPKPIDNHQVVFQVAFHQGRYEMCNMLLAWDKLDHATRTVMVQQARVEYEILLSLGQKFDEPFPEHTGT